MRRPQLVPPLLLALPLALALVGCSAQRPAPSTASSWGGYPSYLPADTLGGAAVHTVLDASASSPALAVSGDPVRVHLGGATVLVDLLGPSVERVVGTSGAAVQWRLTFHDASGTVPLSASAFRALDGRGGVLPVAAAGTAPAVVRPGERVRLVLSATVLAGQGRLRWIPSGHVAPVEWDYAVEVH